MHGYDNKFDALKKPLNSGFCSKDVHRLRIWPD